MRAETDTPIDRAVTFRFPDEERMRPFLADGDSLGVREEHFPPAVAQATLIARHDRE